MLHALSIPIISYSLLAASSPCNTVSGSALAKGLMGVSCGQRVRISPNQ